MGQGAFREHRFHGVGGLQLYARAYGPEPRSGAATPVICLPGLTRNSRDFHELATFLASSSGGGHPVISLDYRGRGNSERDDDKSRYTVAIETSDVITACTYFAIEKAIFIGTSRGGLILHLLAQQMPSLIAAVILNDIGPVIEREGLLAIRDYLNNNDKPRSWEDAAAHLKTLHGAEFPALDEADWREMANAIYRDENGYPIPDFDQAIAKQLLSLDGETALPDLWQPFQALCQYPLLLIRAENSRLLTEKTVAEMHRRHCTMMSAVAAGQGHAPLLHVGGLRSDIAIFLQTAANDI
ncbi:MULTISPECIES: alpha/beta hydrolase [unclassified Ensifer]|uniref:alpha/beta fold hydrolase n=1 Tax=unclassified Ensifer TaxID=2633371 RepID=UPI000813A603|nr:MULTISPECIES: alpha/beta hydrolase [unclassified Ensifer]OCP16598.1 hydrolase [Ensifer sp. LC54]OCP20210.1 hydrolase [Ensifer sp. LC384]